MWRVLVKKKGAFASDVEDVTTSEDDGMCAVMRAHCDSVMQAMAEIRAAVEKCCVRLRVCLHDMYRNEEAMRGVYISGISGGLPPSLAASQLSVKLDRCGLLMLWHASPGPARASQAVENTATATSAARSCRRGQCLVGIAFSTEIGALSTRAQVSRATVGSISTKYPGQHSREAWE